MAKYGLFKYGTIKYGAEEQYIFNRTSADLANDTSKAYVNYFDLNRIETRMREIADFLNDYGYKNAILTKTDWIYQVSTNDLSNFPLLSQLKRMHDNEEKLIKAFYTYPTTPQLPSTFENLTIYTMNDIEKILYDLRVILLAMQKSFNYCGQYECGEI